MIVDAHTHIFPPAVRDNREKYIEADPNFAEMYAAPHQRVATAEDLLESMEEAGVDRSVVLGFGWSEHKLCIEHNEYILEACAASGGRLIPFCTSQPKRRDPARSEIKRCVTEGARGLGELRPESQGYDLEDSEAADILAWALAAYDLLVTFHVSEPVGHPYPGKRGLPLSRLYSYAELHPELTIIAAHWGGGLPFYLLMPEGREVLAQVYYDTAATSLLYDAHVFRVVGELAGYDHILFGSDFPLLNQKKQREYTEACLPEDAREAVMGGNLAGLLRL